MRHLHAYPVAHSNPYPDADYHPNTNGYSVADAHLYAGAYSDSLAAHAYTDAAPGNLLPGMGEDGAGMGQAGA